MDIFVNLIVGAAMGIVCCILAKQRGRSPVGWFFVGFFTGCIGLIIILVLPDLRVQEAKERKLELENRRLREQVRKDRMIADQRHAEAARRLSAHDAALGVDTQAAALPGAAPSLRPLPPAAQGVAPARGTPEILGAQWHYADGARPAGPVPFPALRSLFEAGRVGLDTRVWRTGMADWARIQDLPDLLDALDA